MICTEHIIDHYIGQDSLKYIAVCLRCRKIFTKQELDEWTKTLNPNWYEELIEARKND